MDEDLRSLLLALRGCNITDLRRKVKKLGFPNQDTKTNLVNFMMKAMKETEKKNFLLLLKEKRKGYLESHPFFFLVSSVGGRKEERRTRYFEPNGIFLFNRGSISSTPRRWCTILFT
jgi:hypothetical protein